MDRRGGGGGSFGERVVVQGGGARIEWRRHGSDETVTVQRGHHRRSGTTRTAWTELALRALRERHERADAPATSLQAQLALAGQAHRLARDYLYGNARPLRSAARTRLIDEARASNGPWAHLPAPPIAQAGHHATFLADTATCLHLAAPPARGLRLLLLRVPFADAHGNLFPPAGLGHLAGVARALGVHTDLLDLAPLAMQPGPDGPEGLDRRVAAALDRELAGRHYDLTGVSCHDARSWSLVTTTILPRLSAHTSTLALGGLVAGNTLWKTGASPVDFVVPGEGELALAALLGALGDRLPLDAVPSLWRPREPGEPRSPLTLPDYTWLPTPSYQGLDLSRYDSGPSGLGKPFLPYQFIRGCPFSCAFCADESSRKVRQRPALKVADDLERLSVEHGVRDFFFVNNLINLNPGYLEAFVAAMEAKRLPLAWVDCARPKGISADLYARLAAIGCRRLTFGVDGGSDRMLQLARKKLTIDEAEQSIRAAHAAGIQVAVNLIVAMPHETEADFQSMCAFVERNRRHVTMFRPMAYVYTPGSPHYNEPARFGLARRGSTFEADDGPAWDDYVALRERRFRYIAEQLLGDQASPISAPSIGQGEAG